MRYPSPCASHQTPLLEKVELTILTLILLVYGGMDSPLGLYIRWKPIRITLKSGTISSMFDEFKRMFDLVARCATFLMWRLGTCRAATCFWHWQSFTWLPWLYISTPIISLSRAYRGSPSNQRVLSISVSHSRIPSSHHLRSLTSSLPKPSHLIFYGSAERYGNSSRLSFCPWALYDTLVDTIPPRWKGDITHYTKATVRYAVRCDPFRVSESHPFPCVCSFLNVF